MVVGSFGHGRMKTITYLDSAQDVLQLPMGTPTEDVDVERRLPATSFVAYKTHMQCRHLCRAG